jgi:hypothetical protein
MENKKVAFCDVSGIGTSRVHALVCLQGQDPVDKNFGCLWSNLALDVCLVHALAHPRTQYLRWVFALCMLLCMQGLITCVGCLPCACSCACKG